MKKRLVVGISGGSGIPLATELLSQLRKIEEIALADVVYDNKDIGVAIADA